MPVCNRGDHKADRAGLVRGSRDLPAESNIEEFWMHMRLTVQVNLKCIRKRGVS
jgi:hypothetical protein